METMQPQGDSLRLSIRKQCTESLYFLAKSVLGFRDFTAELHLPICNFLQSDFVNGAASPRKLIIVPRGHFKSSIVSVAYPIWRLLPKGEGWEDIATDGPNARILLSGCTATNAEHFLRKIKSIFETNSLFQWLFPELIPDKSRAIKWTETEICVACRAKNYPESSIETIGVGGRVTGRHYTDIIEDDLVELTVANNQEEMDKIIEWHEYAESLLEVPERDRTTVDGTRYTQGDLYGYIKTNDKRYLVYERTAIEQDRPIFPQRFTMESLNEMKQRKPYSFATQYMNNPIDPSVVDFKAEWLRYYKLTPKGRIEITSGPEKGRTFEPRTLNTYILVDPAISEDKDACQTAIVNVGTYDPEHIFVLNASAKRINPLQTIEAVFSLARILRPHKVGVEAIAYQKALSFFMKQYAEKQDLYLNVVEMKPDRGESKDARIRGLVNYFASGQVYIRAEFSDFIEQYLSFPVGKLRDLLDALSYAPSIWSFPELSEVEVSDEELQEAAIADGRSAVTGY